MKAYSDRAVLICHRLKLQGQKKNLANLSLSNKLSGDESITKSLLDLRKLF